MKKVLFIVATIFCTVLLVVEGSPAQTTICSGDTVVLVLNGYKQGSTLWLESSDLITWSKATGTAYNDSLVIVGAKTLYYRARVTDGSCGRSYSDTVMVTVRPALPPPTAMPASGIAPISFDANWSASAGATMYYLDVATDSSFTSFVTGYNNLKVNNKTTYSVNGILIKTTYYYRVRVYDDSCGRISGNSNTIIVTTPDYPAVCVKSTCSGNILDTRNNRAYKTVQIGSQCWMQENLDVGKMIKGALPQTKGLDNQNADIEKYCYGDITTNCTTYGGLYLWDEMMAYMSSVTDGKGPQGICPTGWHIPTDNEWKCLEMTLGMSQTDANNTGARGTTEGGKLKNSSLWNSPNKGATNNSGFTGLPGGYQNIGGGFNYKGDEGDWWTATEFDANYAWSRVMGYNSPMVGRYYTVFGDYSKNLFGYSVRCVKD